MPASLPVFRGVAAFLVLSLTLMAAPSKVGADGWPDRDRPLVASPSLTGIPASGSGTDALHPTWRSTERLAGFSAHGSHYLYLEVSRDTGAGLPQAKLQLVDLAHNTCLEQGCLETAYRESDARPTLQEAENSLLRSVLSLRQTWKLMDLENGQSVTPLSRSRTAQGEEWMTIPLPSGHSLELQLQQRRVTTELPRAAMQLTIRHRGQTQVLGSLQRLHPAVLDYSIREVQLSPDGRHVAVLVTALQPTFEGTLGTTLVQGFTLP